MRRKEFEAKNQKSLEDVLKTAEIGTLSFNGPDGFPRITPLNFAYDGRILWHGAIAGERFDCLQRDPRSRPTAAEIKALFSKLLNEYQASWRRAIVHAIEAGVPTPAFSTALSFFHGYRTGRLPANLLQAQRDFFGAHTYERVDKPRGEFFHTNWTGRGGTTSSSTYTL